MQMTSVIEGDMLVATPQDDRLDAARALAFKEQMRRLIEEHPDRIVIDLGQVAFLDSSGLGALVAVMKSLGKGRKLELAACQPAVTKVLRLTRMDQVFLLHDDLPAARMTAALATGPVPVATSGDA